MDISVHDTVLHIEEGHGECGGWGDLMHPGDREHRSRGLIN